jgi:hypothetical protein
MSSIQINNTTNQEILKDIKSLQTIEQDLFKTLETNPFITTEEQKQILKKINSISQMRINLYQTLGDVNSLYKNTLVNSRETLRQETFAIAIIEKQLNEAKKKLKLLESEKNNKIRLIEINDYYGEKYNEHGILMKYLIFMLVPIIIISFLFNKGFLPKFIFYILLLLITIIGSIFIVYRLLSIWSRDNMNYQEYLWSFNIKSAPTVIKKTGGENDPWLSSNSLGIGTCIGSNCCTTGMTYDDTLDKCIPDKSTCSQISKKEAFMNDIFTQKSSLYKKPDVTLDSIIMPSNY